MNLVRRFLLGILCCIVVGGVGCKDQAVSLQTSNNPTSTPEQAWALYVEGWKEGNIDKVLSACAPAPETQKRCRGQFEIIQKSGHMDEIVKKIEKGKLEFKGKTGAIGYYDFVVDGEAAGVSFQFVPDRGWKLEQF
jgi:hypothetical protein